MIPRPPRSTLFPYRRSSDLHIPVRPKDHDFHGVREHRRRASFVFRADDDLHLDRLLAVLELHRSEEHTSELQSHSDLVCRLLLEKKKKKNIIYIITIMTHKY